MDTDEFVSDTQKPGTRPGRSRLPVILVFIVLVLGIALSAFLFRYKTTVFDESVLLIDRWFGETIILYSNGTYKRIERGTELRGPGLQPLDVFREDDARASGEIKWRNGRIYLHLEIKPLTAKLKKARRDKKTKIHVRLLDRDGFLIQSFDVPVYRMTPVRDEENKITSLEFRTYKTLPKTDFRAIHGWDLN